MLSGYALATLNALWNSVAFILMLFGYRAIRRKQRETHRRFMLAAFGASCLFLASYLTRIVLYGDTVFGGQGAIRVVYLVILASHILLAMAVAPLVITTLTFGLRERIESHRKVARFTLPAWAYVSVTGVVVYLMLYQM
ncbi:MAG: DUF420 domain-containing protein [Myxococcales bacterium]|nr:DUF420 domain-containing protein [Myxococcales bacterium]